MVQQKKITKRHIKQKSIKNLFFDYLKNKSMKNLTLLGSSVIMSLILCCCNKLELSDYNVKSMGHPVSGDVSSEAFPLLNYKERGRYSESGDGGLENTFSHLDTGRKRHLSTRDLSCFLGIDARDTKAEGAENFMSSFLAGGSRKNTPTSFLLGAAMGAVGSLLGIGGPKDCPDPCPIPYPPKPPVVEPPILQPFLNFFPRGPFRQPLATTSEWQSKHHPVSTPAGVSSGSTSKTGSSTSGSSTGSSSTGSSSASSNSASAVSNGIGIPLLSKGPKGRACMCTVTYKKEKVPSSVDGKKGFSDTPSGTCLCNFPFSAKVQRNIEKKLAKQERMRSFMEECNDPKIVSVPREPRPALVIVKRKPDGPILDQEQTCYLKKHPEHMHPKEEENPRDPLVAAPTVSGPLHSPDESLEDLTVGPIVTKVDRLDKKVANLDEHLGKKFEGLSAKSRSQSGDPSSIQIQVPTSKESPSKIDQLSEELRDLGNKIESLSTGKRTNSGKNQDSVHENVVQEESRNIQIQLPTNKESPSKVDQLSEEVRDLGNKVEKLSIRKRAPRSSRGVQNHLIKQSPKKSKLEELDDKVEGLDTRVDKLNKKVKGGEVHRKTKQSHKSRQRKLVLQYA